VRFIAEHTVRTDGGLRWGVETPDPNGRQAAASYAVLAIGFEVACGVPEVVPGSLTSGNRRST
jgi:hypothetical protein